MPGLLGWNNDAMRGLLSDFTTGVSRLPYRSLGAPVDLATGLLRPFGYDVEKPIGGSDWMIEKAAQMGIARKPTGTGAELAGDVVGGLLDPNPGPEAALAMKAAGLLGDPSTGGLLQALTVFHGSPHRINNVDEANPMGRFDLSKVGTGEGSQAYGHGIYLAENPNVARQYRDTFAIRNDAAVDLKTGESLAVPAWVQQRMDAGEVDSVIDDFSERLRKMHEYKAESPQPWLVDSQIQSAERILKAAKEFKGGNAATVPAAHFYTVDLPDEHIANMLDWDAPLSEQPEAVKKLLRGSDIAPDESVWDQYTGQQLYEGEMQAGGPYKASGWANAESRKAVSEKLRSLGIPGIKYFDGGSRAAGEGTRNFVIFDGDTAKILKRE